jgi:hypothetical protein
VSTPIGPVTRARSIVSVALSDTSPKVGRPVDVTITVATDPADLAVAGTVAVLVEGQKDRTITLVNGRAELSVRFAPPGSRTLLVRYDGSAKLLGVSASRTVQVHP